MNYFVPPQGGIPTVYQPQLAALQQVQVNPSLAPQMYASPPSQLHMLAPMGAVGHHLQQTSLMQPRLVQAHTAQLPQVNAHYAAAVAASQYQAVQAARQQAAAQRAITSFATMRQAMPARTPPVQQTIRKDTVDAEVQTPENDVNPEADSSTKTKIITSILANCSSIVSSQYHHLQSRLFTWGEKQERQALEISRIKADVAPDMLITTPVIFASVVIFDEGTLQFCFTGKVLHSTKIVGKEDAQIDDREFREYLDKLGDQYTYCSGYSEANLSTMCLSTFNSRHSPLIKILEPFPRALSPNCEKWCKIEEGSLPDETRCKICASVLNKLSKTKEDLSQSSCSKKRKRQGPVSLADIPMEPQAKKPKLSTSTLKEELAVLQQQIVKFQESPSSANANIVEAFLANLNNDLIKAQDMIEDSDSDDQEEINEDGTEDKNVEGALLIDTNEALDHETTQQKEESSTEETSEQLLAQDSASKIELDNDIQENQTTDTENNQMETSEECVVNGTDSLELENGNTQNGVEIVKKIVVEGQEQSIENATA